MNRFFSLLLLAVLLPVFVEPAGAGPHDPTDKNLVFATLRGSVMSIHPEGGTLVVAERGVRLIAHEKGGRILATLVQDAYGNPYPLHRLRTGEKVFVRGFEQPDGSIMAREIYALPANSVRQRFPFEREVPDWNWTEKAKQ